MKCPNCGFDSPPGMRYCGNCGTRLASETCPTCGFESPFGYRFCGRCGTQLAGELPALVETTEPAPAALSLLTPAVESSPSQASPALIRLEGERRVVTVVLADITSSTDLLERLGTEAWVELMNRVFHILESEVYRFGGEVHQFRGDGLLAFFGASSAHEDDPERAVMAALSMQAAISRFAAEVFQRQGFNLQMRVGVNTDEVIVGSVGDQRRHSEDTAMGIAVAIAARLEEAAEPGSVLVGEHTYRLAEAHFEWQPLGKQMVRGVSQPIAVYRPLAPKADPDRGQDLPALQYSIPLIGREAEFHALKQCIEGLFDGRSQIVMLAGDKGIGKSFLVNEVREYFLRRGLLLAEVHESQPPEAASLIWLRGRCRSYDQAWPYSMWLDLLHDWLGRRHGEPKPEMRERLRRQAEALWGDSFAEHYPYLATFLGLPLEAEFQERIRHLDGEGLRQRFFLAIRSWVATLARRGLLVLAFGDMQWADASSLSLLKHCLPLCEADPLLYLLVFRPDRASPVWEFRHYVETEYPHRQTTLELSALTEAESDEVIGWLIGPNTLARETRALILQRAEGNPYYLRELVQSLIAQGILVQDGEAGSWRATRTVTSLDLPDSLQHLLLTRIDRLSPEERSVLQMASVIGLLFWLNVLQALAGDGRALKANLAALQRAQLIREVGRVPELEMEYRFTSPLIREAAYESLLGGQRAAHHHKAADYLERLVNSETLVDYYGMLAYHYRGAGVQTKELFYTLLAAEGAKRVYANAEALERYARALELLDEMQAADGDEGRNYAICTQRFEVLNGRREVLLQMGRLEDAQADARALLPLAQNMPDDPIWLIDALLAQPEVINWQSRDELLEGHRMVEEALGLAEQGGDQHRVMRALNYLASARLNLKDSSWHALAERALGLARQLGDLKTEVNLLVGIGKAYGLDNLPPSEEYLEAALSRSEKLEDKAIEITLLNALGQRFERRGDYYRQLNEYELKRLQISREIGNRIVEGQALMYCGQIQALYLGDLEGGLALEREALRIWENVPSRLFPLLRIAQIQIAQGNCDAAHKSVEDARPIGGGIFDDLGRAGLGLVEAILLNAIGDEVHLRMALEITQGVRQMVADNLVSRQYQMAAACEAAAAHLRLAYWLAGNEAREADRQEHLRLAIEASQVALNLFREFGFVQIIECTSEEILFRHSRALAANGRTEEAADFLRQANAEMMRKFDLIPAGSPYRVTYLENIPLHRELFAAHEALAKQPAVPP